MVPIADNLLLVPLPVGATERATGVLAASDGRSIHGQADATAAFESLVALSLVQYARQGHSRDRWI